jgi:hypothetical protein
MTEALEELRERSIEASKRAREALARLNDTILKAIDELREAGITAPASGPEPGRQQHSGDG